MNRRSFFGKRLAIKLIAAAQLLEWMAIMSENDLIDC